jgi:hypothetical protein
MGTKKRQTRTYNTFSDSDSAVNNYLNNAKRVVENTPKSNDQSLSAEMELIMKRKRSNILTIATKTGIKEADDWTKFNKWMLNSSVHHKALNAYNYDELDELHKQFRQLEINYENSAQKVGNKAWHHATGIPRSSQN